MTEIEKQALALLNEVQDERLRISFTHIARDASACEALCRAIEQHEAFRQEVSDAVELSIDRSGHDGLRAGHINEYLGRFIIPAPKPDLLIEVLRSVGGDDRDYCDYPIYAKEIRAALDALGFEIREKNDD